MESILTLYEKTDISQCPLPCLPLLIPFTGENSKEEKIPMTAPVIFRRSPDGDAGWLVSFFVPSKFATKDDVPLPNNEDMSIMSLEGATYAVRVFDGFATIWYVLSFAPSLLASFPCLPS